MSQSERKPQEYDYSVITPDTDPKKSVICKKGPYEVEFTLEEIEKNQNELSKMKREAQGKLEVESAVMQNVAHFYPAVLELSEEVLHAAWMYSKAKTSVAKAEGVIKSCEDELSRILEEKEYIMEKLGFVKSDVVASEEPNPLPPTE